MGTLSQYLAYKRDTSRLIYWLIKTSNAIILSHPSSPPPEPSSLDNVPNTTGQITVSALVSLSKLIARHINPATAPAPILGLFDSVIRARNAQYVAYSQHSDSDSDPEVEQSNASHKHFIDALVEAFTALGGRVGDEAQKATRESPGTLGDEHAALDRVLFANSFAVLSSDDPADEDDDDNESDDDDGAGNNKENKPRKTRVSKKAAKSGKGKSRKTARSKKKAQGDQPSIDVAMESCSIVHDSHELAFEYKMACKMLAAEWADIRVYLQDVWRDTAYRGQNSVVAGTLSHMAVSLVERMAASIFVDFRGHDAFEEVLNTLTHNDPDNATSLNCRFIFTLCSREEVRGPRLAQDVKEHLLYFAYRDLRDFATDFQKNRNGKPTKRMLKELGNWYPHLDLQHASEGERREWRRKYTINWLYDLVNVYMSVVMMHKAKRGEPHTQEAIDWAAAGPWGDTEPGYCVYGLDDFAGYVTHLALQKPGSDIRSKILPHHVFKLQCIVDAFTVSRGWSLCPLKGHVVTAPPEDFRPLRDVDVFVDWESKRQPRGVLYAFNAMMTVLEKDQTFHSNPPSYNQIALALTGIRCNILLGLGEVKNEINTNADRIPPSRFASSTPNGLWEYSPFLCGVGLAEALVQFHCLGMGLMDSRHEAVLMIHLHNMLVQKGYLPEKGFIVYSFLQQHFTADLFVDGKPPTANFASALRERHLQGVDGRRRNRSKPQKSDREKFFDLSNNAFFKFRSFLVTCWHAEWNFDRISDTDVPIVSELSAYRVSKTKRTVDPSTGKLKLDDTELVQRMRAAAIKDMSDEDLANVMDSLQQGVDPGAEAWQRATTVTARAGFAALYHSHGDLRGGYPEDISSRQHLELLRNDIYHDVAGLPAMSSVNYVYILTWMVSQFQRVEAEMRRIRHPIYVSAFETEGRWRGNERFGLVHLAMLEGDEECLRLIARELKDSEPFMQSFIYWDWDVKGRGAEGFGEGRNEECTVM